MMYASSADALGTVAPLADLGCFISQRAIFGVQDNRSRGYKMTTPLGLQRTALSSESVHKNLYCTLRVEPPIDFSGRAKMTGEVKQDTCATTNKTQGEDGKDTFISCKQLWRTISGKCYKVTKSTVSKKLDEASLMIQQGFGVQHRESMSIQACMYNKFYRS
uniref:Uncharacterized protein n=1 Tax=Timema tahoe TaxID=61484 RepID=A0A7R9IDF2_9NEOP|nr:unnamed protein product [Timema tahoe]